MSRQNQRGRSPVATWLRDRPFTRRREWLPGSGMLYFFSQRVSLTICLYLETCNMGGKPVTKRDELAGGTGQRGTPRCF